MDLFMPAERVLYDRSYYFSDEAVDDYNEYIADRDGVNVDVVSSLDFFMNEVWKEIDYAIDNDLFDEISCFDRMLRDLKCGDDPEHPTEISVVAKGTVERWDRPSRGLVVADSLLSLIQGTGSADALRDCQIDRIVDTNGELHIEASHHDGSAYLDVRLISGVSYDAKGFKLGGEYCAPGKRARAISISSWTTSTTRPMSAMLAAAFRGARLRHGSGILPLRGDEIRHLPGCRLP